MPRLRAAESLRQIDAYGFSAAAAASDGTPGSRLPRLHLREGVDSLAMSFGRLISSHVKSVSEENLRRILQAAGFYTLQPRRFVGYQALGTIVLGALAIWFAVVGNGSPAVSIVLVIAAFLGGWSLPLAYVKRRGRSRGERIDLDMPDLIDMLVATVEAGVAFSSSLQMAARRLSRPLGEELRLTLQEQSMGLGLNHALNNMLSVRTRRRYGRSSAR